MQIIAGKHKKRRLKGPYGDQTRPTTSMLRETVFNICCNKIEGALFLDIFSGSGAMGLEALSRGATHATFIENSPFALKALKENVVLLQESSHITIFPLDVMMSLKQLISQKRLFDLIYIDPPYGKKWSDRLLQFMDTYCLLQEEGSLFIEDTSFEFQPKNLLQLKSERKTGRALLKEYIFAPATD